MAVEIYKWRGTFLPGNPGQGRPFQIQDEEPGRDKGSNVR